METDWFLVLIYEGMRRALMILIHFANATRRRQLLDFDDVVAGAEADRLMANERNNPAMRDFRTINGKSSRGELKVRNPEVTAMVKERSLAAGRPGIAPIDVTAR